MIRTHGGEGRNREFTKGKSLIVTLRVMAGTISSQTREAVQLRGRNRDRNRKNPIMNSAGQPEKRKKKIFRISRWPENRLQRNFSRTDPGLHQQEDVKNGEDSQFQKKQSSSLHRMEYPILINNYLISMTSTRG